MHSPETWPQQAKLLADGKKEELKKLQEELKGGRKV
jgi:large subunit ribosomal protein L21